MLTDINFSVSGGESIGIVGPSGAGKSTLVQLLLRLRGPVDGRFLINEQPAEGFRREDWYRQVSYVPQEPRLLHATVAENIRFFRDIDDAQVQRAARAGADPRRRRRLAEAATTRSSGRARTPSRAVSSSASASLARSPRIPTC